MGRTRAIVPIAQLGQRPPEHGRLRIGTKSANGAPVKLETWRFTSASQSAIEAIAKLYGGTCQPWNEPKANPQNQFDVITEANEIDVWLPPDALTQHYELWSGGGCLRRCDGIQAVVQNGDEDQEVACVCVGKGTLECKPTTRLKVVVPGVEFGGVWRVQSTGWNAAQELAGMEDLIQQMQASAGGMIPAKLRLEKRRSQRGKKVNVYMVPVLSLSNTPLQLLSGEADVTRMALPAPSMEIPQAAMVELGTGAPWDQDEQGAGEVDHSSSSAASAGSIPVADGPSPADPDDEILDAEIVDDDDHPLYDQAQAVLALPGAPLLSPTELLDELGDDAVRKLNALLDGTAKWNAHGKVVKA